MKTLSTFLLLFISSIAFTQVLDMNGFPAGPVNVNGAIQYQDQMASAALPQYDSIRPITELNTAVAEAYPWISSDGLRLYFTRDNQFMFSERPTVYSNFNPPTNIAIPNPASPGCWLSEDELNFYFINSVATIAHWSRPTLADPFVAGPTVAIGGSPNYSLMAGVSFSPAMDELYLFGVSLGSNYIARFTGSGNTFTFDNQFTFGINPSVGQLSKDGLQLFVGRILTTHGTIGGLNRPTLANSFTTWVTMDSVLNDFSVYNTHPTASANNEYMVIVRNVTNLWADNELYIAKQNINTSIKENNEINCKVYPVPATDYISFTLESNKKVSLNITNSLGQLVFNSEFTSTHINLNIETLPVGIYNYVLSTEGKSSRGKFIKN
jgi:hypothetical protein